MNETALDRPKSSLWYIMGHKVWESLTTAARLIYVALDFFFKTKEICWPSYSKLKEKSGINSDATISKAINELEAVGLITRKQRGSGKSNLYQKSLAYLQSSSTSEELSQEEGQSTSSLNEEVALQNIKGTSSINEDGPLQPVKGNNNKKNIDEKNNNNVVVVLCGFGLEEKKTGEIVRDHDQAHLEACIRQTLEKATGNRAGYFLSILGKELAPTVSQLEELNQEAEEKRRKEKQEADRKSREEEDRENERLDQVYQALSPEEKAQVDRKAEEAGAGPFKLPEDAARRQALRELFPDKCGL